MSIIFAYPTIAAPTASVVLSQHVERLPGTRPVRKFQSAFDTDAGNQLVYDWGAKTVVLNVTLYPLSDAERLALLDFYDNTVNGRVEAFEHQDALGVIRPVRFATDVFDASQVRPTFWQVMLTMREIV